MVADRKEYQKYLDGNASLLQGASPSYSFTRKRLIDIFLYTRFAHQPQAKRVKQFNECLQEVGNSDKLEWMFYIVIGKTGFFYSNANQFIENELQVYLEATGKSPSFDATLFEDGLGAART